MFVEQAVFVGISCCYERMVRRVQEYVSRVCDQEYQEYVSRVDLEMVFSCNCSMEMVFSCNCSMEMDFSCNCLLFLLTAEWTIAMEVLFCLYN